jgi:hypothetical protein
MRHSDSWWEEKYKIAQEKRKMPIYILCHNEDIGCTSDCYVTRKEDIPQLAIDFFWGTLIKPSPGRLVVTVDDTSVKVRDTIRGSEVEYVICTYDQRKS